VANPKAGRWSSPAGKIIMDVRHFLKLFTATVMLVAAIAAPAAAIEHGDTPQNDETRDNLISEGTLVRISMLQTISTAHCTDNQKFTFRVMDDVKAGSRVAIPAGTTGSGRVTLCQPAHGDRRVLLRRASSRYERTTRV